MTLQIGIRVMNNLEGVVKYLDKMYGSFIQTVMADPEDKETVVLYGRDGMGNSHWRFYIHMVGLCTELEVDDGYCVNQRDIRFFNDVYDNIEEIADIYHKRKIGFNV